MLFSRCALQTPFLSLQAKEVLSVVLFDASVFKSMRKRTMLNICPFQSIQTEHRHSNIVFVWLMKWIKRIERSFELNDVSYVRCCANH